MGQISGREPLHILSGNVIHGRGIGKLVGMPTANMEVSDESTLPPAGVYITEILLDGQVYYGITNIGTRPTVDNDREISVETHILNFNEEIYGKSIRIQLFNRLRSQQKFENFSLLLEQIRMDCVMSPSLRLSSPNLCTSYSAMYHNIVIFHFPLRMFCTLTIAAHWGSGAFILLM